MDTCASGAIFRRNQMVQRRGKKLKKNTKKEQDLRKKAKKIEKKVHKRRKKCTGFLNSDIGVKIGSLGGLCMCRGQRK
jgi:hypothetical protein